MLTLFGVLTLTAQAKDWPAPIKALEKQGVEVIGTFDAPGGLTGYAGIVEQQPIAVYLTADEKYAIVGPMIDGKGANLSQQPLEKLVSKPMTDRVWKDLEKSTWIGDGKKMRRVSSTPLPTPTALTATSSGMMPAPGSRPAKCSCATSWSPSSGPPAQARPQPSSQPKTPKPP